MERKGIVSMKKFRSGVYAILMLALSSVSGLSSLRSEAWKVPHGLQSYRVIRAIDGDTVELDGLGKVRYIGINTPETKHPSKGVEFFGPEAYEAHRRLVEGKRIKVEFDVGKKDRYGRYLVYAYVGSTFVNAYLVEAGYAQVMTIPPNVRYADLFVQLQHDAREHERGLWRQRAEPAKPVYWGNRDTRKLHRSTCPWARKMKRNHRVVFPSRKAAIDHGYLPCKVCKP